MAGPTSPLMRNMMLSMFLAYMTTKLTDKLFENDPYVVCEKNVNDYNWYDQYKNAKMYSQNKMHRQSFYVPMSDGVQLAVDITVPTIVYKKCVERKSGCPDSIRVPTVLFPTRHGRAYKLDFPFSLVAQQGDKIDPRMSVNRERFNSYGYAWVSYEIRGTGVSMGKKKFDFSPEEIADGKDILDWISSQKWSNEKVVAYGLGLDGNGALLLAATQHKSLKAIALNGVPTQIFENALFPGGVMNKGSDLYSSFTYEADQQIRWNSIPTLKSRLMMKTFGGNIYPVNKDMKSVRQAVEDHKENPNLSHEIKSIKFKDDKFTSSKYTIEDMEPFQYLDKIIASKIPIYQFAGYFDMATAQGAIRLYQALTKDEKANAENIKENLGSFHRLTLGPWGSAGSSNADPFARSKTQCFRHVFELERFFDYHIYKEDSAFLTYETKLAIESPIHYFTMSKTVVPNPQETTHLEVLGQKWTQSKVWPPLHVDPVFYYFATNHSLIPEDMDDIRLSNGKEEMEIDYTFQASTEVSRWDMMKHIFASPPRYRQGRENTDDKFVIFKSEIFHSGSYEITGDVELKLFFSIDSGSDVAIIAYLEDMDYSPYGALEEDMRRVGATYITEAVIRPGHSVNNDTKLRSFKKNDYEPLTPNKVYETTVKFQPVSYLMKRGHQLRVSIACADAQNLKLSGEKLDLASKLTVHYGAKHPSGVVLPRHVIPLSEKIKEEEQREAAKLLKQQQEDEFKMENEEL